MSLIHQALTRPYPATQRRSGFNPLRRRSLPGRGLHWWGLALVALTLAGALLWSGGWAPVAEPTTVEPVTIVLPKPNRPAPAKPAAVQAPETTQTQAPAKRETTPVEAAAATEQPAPVPTATATEPEPSQPTLAQPEPAPQPVAQAQPPARQNAGSAAAPVAATTAVASADSDFQLRVQNAIAANDLSSAEQQLRAWIATEPAADQPRLWLAKILLSQQRLGAIAALLDGRNSVEARGLRALWHEKAGRPEQAAALFEQLARDEPGQGQWRLHWAINAENSGQLAQARLLYQTYLDDFAAANPSLTAFAQDRMRSLESP